MNQLIDAALRGEIVTCTILSVEEHISARGNTTLKILMKCKDKDNMNLDGLLAKYISHNGMHFVTGFLDSLTTKASVLYESDTWIYNKEEFIGNTVRCQLSTREYNDKLYPEPTLWLQVPENKLIDDPLPDFLESDDLPF